MRNEAELYALVHESYVRAGNPERVAVAVSGGADSMALLYLISKFQQHEKAYIHCVHVHHGLRDTAERDAQCVSGFCRAHAIPFTLIRIDIAAGSNLEAAARIERYKALRRAAADNDIRLIALAHHMEDQAETMLMHLMYGAGMAGLSGMREELLDIWRPLLKVRRVELLNLLRDRGIAWCEDETNCDTRITRNAIRLQLMPVMAGIYPGFIDRMAQTADILADEEDALRDYTHRWLNQNAHISESFCWFVKEQYLDASVALQRRVLRAMTQVRQLNLDFTQTERLRRSIIAGTSKTVNLPSHCHAYVTDQRVHIIPPDPVSPPIGEVKVAYPANSLGDGVFTQAFDADMMSGAVLRHRQPGDSIHPLGATGTQSLKQYMIDKRIDKPFRAAWPVLAVGDHVMWVIGYGISQKGAVMANSSRTCFIEYLGSLPDGRENLGGAGR